MLLVEYNKQQERYSAHGAFFKLVPEADHDVTDAYINIFLVKQLLLHIANEHHECMWFRYQINEEILYEKSFTSFIESYTVEIPVYSGLMYLMKSGFVIKIPGREKCRSAMQLSVCNVELTVYINLNFYSCMEIHIQGNPGLN